MLIILQSEWGKILQNWSGTSWPICYGHSFYTAVVARAETRNMKIHATISKLSINHLFLLSRLLTKAKLEMKKGLEDWPKRTKGRRELEPATPWAVGPRAPPN